MLRLTRIPVHALVAGLCAWVVGTADAADDFTFHHENVMGTSLELSVRADDESAARSAEGRVLAEIDSLSAVFSGYEPSSEFLRWQGSRKGPVVVSPELFEVLAASDRWRARSGGAFDPRVEVLTQLWTRSARLDRLPSSRELDAAKALVADPAWRLGPSTRTAERLSDCPLSLNAIAKGYIVERACEAAMGSSRGVLGLLLNVGGDLRVVGDAPRTVGIVPPWSDSESARPLSVVEVTNRAVATSGRSQRGFRVGGRWYSHVLDPRSGLPAEGVASATVIAASSTDADALATVLNVLPPEDGLKLTAETPGAECLVVAADGRVLRSAGWARYERGEPTLLAFAEPAKGSALAESGPGWGDDHELVVNFEINQPDATGRGYRRPYVAVWVEGPKGFPVRNLILWVSQGGSGPFQWLPDLRRWFRGDKERKKVDKAEMIFTMARPTRPPGKYSAAWDGKDDKGKAVAPGEYTVFIDAAREHGTYQSISKKVTVADEPFAEELKGNVEIKSASIEYRRRAKAASGAK